MMTIERAARPLRAMPEHKAAILISYLTADVDRRPVPDRLYSFIAFKPMAAASV
jgi:hypothetical protein